MHGFEAAKLKRMKLVAATARRFGAAAGHDVPFRGAGGRKQSTV
jgi:hypothetical protein